MRLLLLPVSNRRTLLYCQRLNVTTTEKTSLVDKVTARGARLWAGWEKKESGWQKKVVTWGNSAFRRIPFEEWGLKSVPPLSARRKESELKGNEKVVAVFPSSLIPLHKAEGVVARLAKEREALHRKRMIWCLVGMPITVPFALVPVIPNLPFFYLTYRAWSHWRAVAGGKHLQFLLENKLLQLSPSAVLDTVYQRRLIAAASPDAQMEQSRPQGPTPEDATATDVVEARLVGQEGPKEIAAALEVPELEIELERALWQVETAAAKRATENKPPPAPGAADGEKKSQ